MQESTLLLTAFETLEKTTKDFIATSIELNKPSNLTCITPSKTSKFI